MEKNLRTKYGFKAFGSFKAVDQAAFAEVGKSSPALIVAIVDGCLALC